MSIRSILRTGAALTLIAVLVACSSTTSPDSHQQHFTGQFTLTHAAEQAVPATVFDGMIADVATPFHLRIVAKTGSFALSPSGHYEQHVAHDAIIDGAFNGPLTRVDRGECTRSGMTWHCISNYIENVEFDAVVSGQSLTISQDLAGEGHVVSYRYLWISN